jgi:hypothetical protein
MSEWLEGQGIGYQKVRQYTETHLVIHGKSRNGRRKRRQFSNHEADCRKRADRRSNADSGMHAHFPAGKHPTPRYPSAQLVPN